MVMVKEMDKRTVQVSKDYVQKNKINMKIHHIQLTSLNKQL